MIGEYRPLATADGFRLAAAADSTDLHRTVAVAPRQGVVGIGGHVGVVVVRRVVVTHQGTGIARACRAARVGEAAVDDVRAGEDVIEIGGARHVRLKRNLPVGPVAHPAKDRRQVAQQRPRLGTRLQVQVAGEARFLAALAIRNQLVAILRDAVQLPFVDHPRLDAAAQAKAVVDANAVADPRRVIGPGPFEGAVPNAAVAARLRIVVARYPPLLPLALQRHGRNVAELLSTEFHVQQGGVRVAQLGVDHLGDADNHHGVGNAVVLRVGGQPAHLHPPALTCRRQVDTTCALVTRSGFTVHGLTQHFHECPAIGGDIHGILDAIALDVAATVLLLQHRPGEAQA
ncbi:hypothetical protein D3C78_788100 [compost metagenome]